jgi:hypothetical protein
VKKHRILSVLLIPILAGGALFYSCGNPFLDEAAKTDGGSGGGGGTNNSAPLKTTEEDIPSGKTPIYIDTQAQFDQLYSLGTMVCPYAEDAYIILRGNGVANRTFTAINSSPINSFRGTLTGWYKDTNTVLNENQQTIIEIASSSSFFNQIGSVSASAVQAKVSWLRFHVKNAITASASGYVGIVAVEAKNTLFDHVTVSGAPGSGTINLSLPNALSAPVYAGGIAGLAGIGTVFESCVASANITINASQGGGNDCYAGGIAGSLLGRVTESTVKGVYNNQITVTAKIAGGDGNAYAGGVAGKVLTGGSIEKTSVTAAVNAEVLVSNAYAGGFVGSIEGGQVSSNESTGQLTVTAVSGSNSSGEGKAYAGGIAGKSTEMIQLNKLTGYAAISITARYYTGKGYAGGLVGHSTASIMNSLINVGTFVSIVACPQDAVSSSLNPEQAEAYAGGLAGYSSATIAASSFTASKGGIYAGIGPYPLLSTTQRESATKAYAGGIAGFQTGITENVFYYNTSAADVQPGQQPYIDARSTADWGTAAAGGIAGKSSGKISAAYAITIVQAKAGRAAAGTEQGASAGGIAGISSHTIEDTFALAQVEARPQSNALTTSNTRAGGIAGYVFGTNPLSPDDACVKTSYAAGWVMAYGGTTGAAVGGIVGYINLYAADPAVTNCFALQQFVLTDGGVDYQHRVVGYLVPDMSSGTPIYPNITGNRAYEGMSPHYKGSPFDIQTPDDKHGDDITAGDAKNFLSYTGFNSAIWKTGGTGNYSFYYPSLIYPDLSLTSVPSWAAIP